MKFTSPAFLILFLFMSPQLEAQVIKDTSFTIRSSYIKEKKSHPQIEIPTILQPASVLVQKDVVFSTIGDRNLLLDIYYPEQKKKKGYPAVLMVFGGGWRSGNKDHWVAYGHKLASMGFVVVAAEYRLSPEAKYPAALHDLKAAVRWMRANAKTYSINKKKIAAMGASAGGQLATLSGTTNKQPRFEGNGGNEKYRSDVQAIINIDGVLAFKHPESSEGTMAAEWLGGTYNETPETWQAASPINHVSKRTPPICFIASSNPRFHAGRTDMIRKMESLGVYSEVHVFQKTPHTFWLFHPRFNDVVNISANFLRRKL